MSPKACNPILGVDLVRDVTQNIFRKNLCESCEAGDDIADAPIPVRCKEGEFILDYRTADLAAGIRKIIYHPSIGLKAIVVQTRVYVCGLEFASLPRIRCLAMELIATEFGGHVQEDPRRRYRQIVGTLRYLYPLLGTSRSRSMNDVLPIDVGDVVLIPLMK